MKKTVFSVFLIIGLVVNGQSQSSDTPPDAQPGKCYAKCFLTEDRKPSDSKWEEVLCSQSITTSIIKDINLALQQKGYDVDVSESAFSAKSKAALNKFQKTFNLPIGSLNIKTLDALEIRY